MMRAIPSDFDPVQLTEVDRRLSTIAKDHNVTIPLAIESGSRAWGFPSPDSDYDVRFIYFRSVEQYINLWPPRDVIEQPIEGDMDVNGWDLAKALKLMLSGNAVVIEWLQSPIVYQCDGLFRSNMLELAHKNADRYGLAKHYYHLGTKQFEKISHADLPRPIKKVLYAARPALALRWLRLHPERSVPPMEFQTLLRESDPSHDIADRFDELIQMKSITRELGSGRIHESLLSFISEEFEKFTRSPPKPNAAASDDIQSMVQNFFFKTITSKLFTTASSI